MCADDHDVASNKGGGGYVLLTNSDNILGDGDVSAGARVADVRTKGSTLAGHGTTQLLAYTTLISPPLSMPLRAFEGISTADCHICLVAATVAIIFLLFKTRLVKRFASKNGIPLPPGPPAWWFWDNPMPSVK